MKKKSLFLFAVCFLMSNVLSFAQIDNLTNLSPEWIRTGARNASTDGTDIMVYNPAGMAFLKPGFHINIGNQSFMRKPSHQFDLGYGTEKYEQDGNDLLVPNLYLSYNKDKWAVFGGAYIAGGGATANFPEGSITTDLFGSQVMNGFNIGAGADYTFTKDGYLKASSYYIAYALGGAYQLSDKISFGIFGRYFSAKNETELGSTLAGSASGLSPDYPFAIKTTDNASGFGVVGGFHFKATDKFDIAVRYESQIGLEFKTTVDNDENALLTDGSKYNRDFPAVAGLGLSYKVKDNFKILFDFNYYFQKNADWGLADSTLYGNVGLSEFAGDASCYGIAFEYNVNSNWLVSLGSVYSLFSYKNQPAYFTHAGAYETVSDNNVTLNFGLAYNVNEKVRINAGFLHAFYSKDKNVDSPYTIPPIPITINNSISSFGIGVDLTF